MLDWLGLVICYVIGGIPFGVIVGKLTRGIDIRDFGSGNIGASNVLRTLGKGPAALVMVLDTVKGLAAVLLCVHVFGMSPIWVAAGALMSVLGHTFSVFLGFRGGKGVATSLGVIFGLDPLIASIALVIWVVLVAVTRYISVASIIATPTVPLLMVFWSSRNVPMIYQILAGVAALAIVVKHISNMKRLLAGTEPRIGQKVDIDGDRGGDESE